VSDLEAGTQLLEGVGEYLAAAAERLHLGVCHMFRNRSDLAAEQYRLAREPLEAAGPSPQLAVLYGRLADLHMRQMETAGPRGRTQGA
jgi:predicted anti-sigma-YlaC factor YlaD